MGQYSAMNSVVAVPLRLVFTLVLLAFPFLAGMASASAWYIAACVPVFVMSDVIGKWRLQFAGKPALVLLKFIVTALLTQTIVVGVIYLLGRGVGSLFGGVQTLDFGTAINIPLVLIYAAIMAVLGVMLLFAERGKVSMEEMVADEINKAMPHITGSGHEPVALSDIPARPVSVDTLFDGPHYSHYEFDHDADENLLVPERAQVTDTQIAETEKQLGVTLPPQLRQIYLTQNGGSIQDVYYGDPSAPTEDDIAPFSGYEDLNPLERLCSVHDAVLNYAHEEDVEMFPIGAKQMIILAQWYRETLFLDYRNGRDAPRVGFYDFDRAEDLQSNDWEDDEEAMFWPDFDSFMAGLYRQDRSEA